MNSIIYLVGLVVIVLFILSFWDYVDGRPNCDRKHLRPKLC